ncbi:MAG: M36 family metallopeptidase, partial [Bryobacteraceae bacterium]
MLRIYLFLFLTASAAYTQTGQRRVLPRSVPALAATARETGQALATREFALGPLDLAGVYVAKEYTSENNGVTHLLYRQRFAGMDVSNAEYAVNIDRDGNILNAGGTLYASPGATAFAPDPTSALRAVRIAVKAVNPTLAKRFGPLQTRAANGRVSFAGVGLADEVEGQPVWYGVRGKLQRAWRFLIVDEDGAQAYTVIVDSDLGSVLSRKSNTAYQSPRGLVFDKTSPQPNPTPGIPIGAPPPFVNRALVPLTGDAVASPLGWVASNETSGNNIVAGENVIGTRFLTNPTTAVATGGDFSFPLLFPPAALSTAPFRDAVSTNLFYWTNRAHDLFYQSGFTEAAGNFQVSNLGRGGVGGDPVYAYSHYGSQAVGGAALNNAFFTWRSTDDGAQAMLAMYVTQSDGDRIFGDGALDPEVVVHEYTHGVSGRLVRGCYEVFQCAAMGEAWSDFFGLEFTLPEGAPANGVYPFAEYFVQLYGQGIRTRPYSTDMKVNPLTFANVGSVIRDPEVHADGEIWMSALWEIRANLIAQFGEKEGRRRIRQIVVDGMKLAVPFPTMVDARDAILLADRVDFNGDSQTQLWAGFAKRGLGALAFSLDADSIHVTTSFDLPSSKGQLRFTESPVNVGEFVRLILQDTNLTGNTVNVRLTGSSGDIEDLQLERVGDIYTSLIPTAGGPVTRADTVVQLIPGDAISAYYTDANAPGGAAVIQTTVSTQQGYYFRASTFTPDTTAETAINLDNFALNARVTLPFDFPFFSKTYRSVWVDINGLLTFGQSNTTLSPCTDKPALARSPSIAPMWMQLDTFGIAQSREGIYQSRGPGYVTFRWVAETYSPFIFPGSPINFSVTLRDDGTIYYNWGSNPNLTPAFVYPGCDAAPVTGVSNGHDTFIQTSVNAVSSWDKRPGLRLDPPFGFSDFPVVKIEKPTTTDKVKGILTISGIAYDQDWPISRLDIVIDGIARAATLPSLSRPDFCATQNVTGCPNVGFSVTLNAVTLGLAPGTHKLQIRANNSRGGFTDAPEQPMTFEIDAAAPAAPVAKLERPAAGDEVSTSLTVAGYAYDVDIRVASVDVLIDGVTVPGARYGF